MTGIVWHFLVICGFLVVQHDPSAHTGKLLEHKYNYEAASSPKFMQLYSGVRFV